MTHEEALAAGLAELEAAGLRRHLTLPSGIDLSSNDYLGLSRHPGLARRLAERLAERLADRAGGGGTPLTAPASRLLAGNTPQHEALEARLARYKGTEAALLFPSGYQANLGLITALVGPGDRALSDAANHASLIDGLRLAGCAKLVYPHLDVAAVEAALAAPHPGGRTFLITESLFSMDGDQAPLDLYADLAARHGAVLLVDDAHATGLFGEARGSGLVERFGVERRAGAVVSTFGKALGVAGACVAGSRLLVDTLVNRCRPFLFSTAPPPLLLWAVEAALDLAQAEPERRRRVLALAERLRDRLAAAGLERPGGEGPIVPVVVGDNRRALAIAEELQRRGFDVRAVRPPTVPEGTARLRLSIHADHEETTIDRLGEAIAGALAGAGSGAPRPHPAAARRGRPPAPAEPAAARALAVVGTGTEIGKTVVSALLLARYGASRRLAYWKPVATGAREGRDSETVAVLAGGAAEVLPETFLFAEPLSPHLAARLEGRRVEPGRIAAELARHLAADPERALVVEGVGGVLVPLTDEGDLLADLLARLGLACLLVAASTLGTINHTLLTLEALAARRVPVAGVALVGPPNPENRRAIERFGGVPVVAEVPPLAPLSAATVAGAAAGLDPDGRLARWLGAGALATAG